jgi:hypothetical protein
MEQDEKDKLQETKEYWAGFPEAPASDSFKWVDTQGFEHLTTIRAWTPSNLFSQMGKMQAAIIATDGKPVSTQQKVTAAPVAQVQEKIDGMPVVDADGNPMMIPLPANEKLYTIKGFYHGQNKDKTKDFLKVVVEEKPHNGKYGHNVFHHPFNDWKAWPLAADPPGLYSMPGYGHVVLRDPKEGEKWAEVVDLRP